MRIEQDIYNQLDEAIKAYAANYLRTAYHTESIPADIWGDIESDLDEIDNNSRFDEITDIIDEHMQTTEDEEETENIQPLTVTAYNSIPKAAHAATTKGGVNHAEHHR